MNGVEDVTADVAADVQVHRPPEAADRPWILITNDDGVDSPGILRLATRLSMDHTVVVVAPSNDRSGAGTGIGRFDPASGVELVDVSHGDLLLYSIDGPPGLAVMSAALGAFGDPPHMVVSGINAGINTGHSVIHSGTVGAALTARTFGSAGLAVSLARSDPWHWDTAAECAARVVDWMLAQNSRPCTFNLNVPALPADRLGGFRWAELAEFGYFQVAVKTQGRVEFQVSSAGDHYDERSDTALLAAGFATLSSLSPLEAQEPPSGSGPRWDGSTPGTGPSGRDR